jgi:hypothetical protein
MTGDLLQPHCQKNNYCMDPRPDRCECSEASDPLGPAKGVINGLLIGSAIWIVVLVIVWAVFIR